MVSEGLTLTVLWANSADDKLRIFSYFSQKIGLDISCKLSKGQILLSLKIRKMFQNVVC